jgi:hypothetical protein
LGYTGLGYTGLGYTGLGYTGFLARMLTPKVSKA